MVKIKNRTLQTIGEYAKGVISGNILKREEVRRRIPYITFIAFLMFLYIANSYQTQRLQRKYIRMNREVQELRAKSLSFTEKRMTSTRQSQIIKELNERNIDLEESVIPPFKLE
ncbi:MAG: hypothetical protein LIO79_04935 [Rikenellaceae bacterium]|nr:hypothetical protein [Rikenellaceae bacterium]